MKEKQNAGFTLLELLIAMMMSMIIILGVGQFLVAATNHYRGIDSQVTLQMDAQDAVNTISDFIMEGNNISQIKSNMYTVYYDLGRLDASGYRISRENANQRIFWLNNGMLYMFHPDSALEYNNIINDPEHSNPMLLAEGVDEFSISIPKADNSTEALGTNGLDAAEYETKNSVPVRVKIKLNSTKMSSKKSITDINFEATQDVAIRNRIESID